MYLFHPYHISIISYSSHKGDSFLCLSEYYPFSIPETSTDPFVIKFDVISVVIAPVYIKANRLRLAGNNPGITKLMLQYPYAQLYSLTNGNFTQSGNITEENITICNFTHFSCLSAENKTKSCIARSKYLSLTDVTTLSLYLRLYRDTLLNVHKQLKAFWLTYNLEGRKRK